MTRKLHDLAASIVVALALASTAGAQSASQPAVLGELERAYADFNDATGAIGLIESGLQPEFAGRTRGEWSERRQQARAVAQRELRSLAGRELSPLDRR